LPVQSSSKGSDFIIILSIIIIFTILKSLHGFVSNQSRGLKKRERERERERVGERERERERERGGVYNRWDATQNLGIASIPGGNSVLISGVCASSACTNVFYESI
jgi:hypothetical protein